ncbi:hypothetical protein mRhiFer1_007915 [Rhinolophus ferrumequinum]|uniref:Gamma-retroviral matrix protein domain-containing protein n=1 Tax=Rhinolophus ferrumequinum TaxID=59479 RepID=A0A7J8AVU5_RHIFE|nr:hypothetical protein mRhiFer1_007915 [Rhinolophus ferrumequinum]
MEGSHGKPMVLDCMLKNFRTGFGGDYGVKMTPGHLCTLCEQEWPSFDVGWPPEGTLDLPPIRRVYIVVNRTPGHSDQFPYVDLWLEIARTFSPWVRFCSNSKGQSRIFIARNPRGRAQKDMTKTIYQGDPDEERHHLPMHHGQWLARPCHFQTLCFQPRPPRGPNPTSLESDFIGLAGIESD